MLPENNSTSSIEQRSFLRGRQKFVIHSDGDLEVTFERFAINRQYKIPLLQINPKPERHKVLNTGSLVGLIIFISFIILIVWGIISCFRSTSDRDVAYFLLIPLVFAVLFGWTCLTRFRQNSINVVIFFLRQNGQIHVWHNKPDAKTFTTFCETLSKKCEEAWNNRPLDASAQSMAGEIAALNNLREKGILSEEEFQKAKARLLDQIDVKERKVGFAQ
jgi:ribosomal protein S20